MRLRNLTGCHCIVRRKSLARAGSMLFATGARGNGLKPAAMIPLGVAAAFSLAVAGCASDDASLAKLKTGLSGGETVSDTGARSSPETSAVIAKARDLQSTGNHKIALEMLSEAHRKTPKDEELRRVFAISALEAGNSRLAYKLTSPKHAPANTDARQLSIRGAALSSLGQHEKAQQAFASALAIKPDDPTLLNNLGLALALKGDAKQAEDLLRRAAGLAQSDRARHNLALVLGLQGRGDEAKKVALTKKPPAIATQTGWGGTVKSSLGGPTTR